MASMNVSLPDPLKHYVKERVSEGEFSNPSDYVRTLIREDRNRRAKERLEELLLEGLDSGEATEMTSSDWDDVRGEVQKKLEAKKN